MFYSVFGEILTLEAHVPILLITLKHNSFNSSISDPPSGSFQRFNFKGNSVRFQQRMKGLFAKFAFLKV